MATGQKRGVTPEQLRDLCKELNLTVAAVADGASLSKAYISEFRQGSRNLSAQQQTQLRNYLEEQCEAAGIDFPENQDGEGAEEQRLAQGVGLIIQRINRPAIMLAEGIPKATVDQLTALMDANRAKVVELLSTDFEPGGMFGGEFSQATDDAIRQVFALLALNYLAILYLQGHARIFVKPIPEDQEPKTIGEWFSRSLGESPLAGPVPELLPAKAPAMADGEGA
ncbi:helix-turn-helix transcriptional regulator [Curvibacter sp. PAE-UM]|uniref:helix-turn-helix domain-containing protein n=1 Tax=Curvibacter sp. PAE-UM TaxID=1714344 RepID=UPI00070F135D|nr:helix-turn-helix transcriptional regulator [Curvibacter sp. PAE-UM]KRH99220.1 hypothetical protein AO057_07110 [Curvibacter sp. PAE-UM]